MRSAHATVIQFLFASSALHVKSHSEDQGPELQSFLIVKVNLTLRYEISKVVFYTLYYEYL